MPRLRKFETPREGWRLCGDFLNQHSSIVHMANQLREYDPRKQPRIETASLQLCGALCFIAEQMRMVDGGNGHAIRMNELLDIMSTCDPTDPNVFAAIRAKYDEFSQHLELNQAS